MKAIAYVHGSKESMYDLGLELGLESEALITFRYCCMELKVELDVDVKTGQAKIVAVDDRRLAK